MGVKNNIKLACHSLWQNKTRTILTTLVLMVMSFVIMFLLSFSTSFFSSINASFNGVYQNEGDQTVISKRIKSTNNPVGYNINLDSLTTDEAQKVSKILKENESFFDTVKFKVGAKVSLKLVGDELDFRVWIDSLMAYDTQFNALDKNEEVLIKGRMWNAEDDNSLNIWLDEKIIDRFALNGQSVTLGDKIVFVEEREYDQQSPIEGKVFTICGIIKNVKESYGGELVYVNYKQCVGKFIPPETDSQPYGTIGLPISSCVAKFSADNSELYTINDFMNREKFNKKLAKIDNEEYMVSSTIKETMGYAYILFGVITVLCLFIAIVITLLSVGSAAQSIKISVEQNRKFIGMMKAIGMRDRNILGMIKWQAVIMTVLGVVVSIGVVFTLTPVISMILKQMLPMVFGKSAVIIASISVLVPIFTVFFLLGFIMLYTRKSLRTIARMDVIAVISEVD